MINYFNNNESHAPIEISSNFTKKRDKYEELEQ